MTKKFVSIIIPTYREAHLLQKCFSALELQTYPKEFFEVIVVNNDPADKLDGVVFFTGNFQIIEESKPGSYAARNTGLKYAKGEIIGLTDSDCVPDKNWITHAVQYFEDHPDCTRIAGNISIIYQKKLPTAVEMYNQIYAFPQQWLVGHGGGCITGNLFTYKYVFDQAGGFDENLLSMGDMEWGRMAQKKGFKVDYVDNVLVMHPARDFKALVKKERRHGGGAAFITQKKTGIKNGINLLYSFRPKINSVRFMLSRRKDLQFSHRFLIPLLRYYLLNIRAFEKFRVQNGKQPNRT